MENENLATEILHELKRQSKYYRIFAVIVAILLIISNLFWIIAWNNLPKADSNCNLNGDNGATVLYNSQGDIDIHGESTNK